ncbi:hypothetical protein [Sphaerisporangium dianthi]|uniref:Uncharacterized protein n=1 Tax=Sphaerisporangium dianthi TaxID=1436120 RepID=A0ABV9CHQ2_9ACTN
MSDFAGGVRRRVRESRERLGAALASGDEYAVQAYAADLEEMVRLAREHGVPLDREPAAGAGSGEQPKAEVALQAEPVLRPPAGEA